MNIKLFFKKLFNPYKFKYLNPEDYYLSTFYEDLINLDNRICMERDKDFINYILFYDDYPDNTIFRFRDCLESMGFNVTSKLYQRNNIDLGVIFTIDLRNLWQIL